MATYVLMRVLESAPSRYDLGIRLLTLGRLERVYDRLASHIRSGQRVLDLGCGTGALTVRAARRGARVKAIDVSAPMLEIAAEHARRANLEENVELAEVGVAELDLEEPDSYDVVMSGLCFSELSDDELSYALGETVRVLRPGGLLLVADEVRPRNFFLRLVHSLLRIPLAALTYVVSQQTTRPVRDLAARAVGAGLVVTSTRSSLLGSFIELVARKPDGEKR